MFIIKIKFFWGLLKMLSNNSIFYRPTKWTCRTGTGNITTVQINKSGTLTITYPQLTMVIKFLVASLISLLSVKFAETQTRDERLFNVFSIVKFPNEGCNTTDNTYGVCYSPTECLSLGGSSRGSCASGFGVCCSFTGSCGGSTSLNNTYFTSSDGSSSPCSFSVCRSSSDICQIRLGFDTFDTAELD